MKPFNDFENAFSFFTKINDCEIKLEKEKEDQNQFKSNMAETKRSTDKKRKKKFIVKYWNALQSSKQCY